MVTVFLSILNELEFQLVQNRKENCRHDHIPFNLKGNRNIVFSVQYSSRYVSESSSNQAVIYADLIASSLHYWEKDTRIKTIAYCGDRQIYYTFNFEKYDIALKINI